ncbi:MAG: hypothetical protein LBB21_04905 [Holosporaceae bacterium]|jgi:hypothetical protein|nr:hypothetical protein [Holosporaceae bacterium]
MCYYLYSHSFYFDPYSVEEIEKTIEKIVSDEDLKKSLTERGWQRVKIFSDNDAMIDDYIHVFEEAMDDNKRLRPQL